MVHDGAVLHVRAVVSDERLPMVLRVVRGEPSVCHLSVLADAVERPPGSLVEFDIPTESANGVITDLKELGVEHDGAITAYRVDVTLSDVADRAERLAPGDPGDAVVWAEVSARTRDEGRMTASYLAFMVLSVLIAAVGILTDSVVLIVGAMVVGPEFGPLSNLAYGLHRRRPDRILEGLRALLLGFSLAIAVAMVFTWAVDLVGGVPAAAESGQATATAFISRPDAFSFVVAVLAGVAGTVALLEAKSTSLVGVFISVTTVPAAADVAVSLALGNRSAASGAFVQLLVNLTCIALTAAVTMTIVRSTWHRLRRRRALQRGAVLAEAPPADPPPA